MTQSTDSLRTSFNQALVTISKLQARIVAADAQRREPIAIVGMGCRYPGGVTDPQSLWRLLDDGLDAVTEVPAERWDIGALYDPDPDAPGKMVTRSGGFLREIDRFDAGFFRISPREAVSMDPQQRLLLETSWEALERAGIVPERLMDSSVGVFVGLEPSDYPALGGGLEKLNGYVVTGNAPSVASGRISYVLGLRGPSITVDTACSSSLVALHLACQALRSGECSMALAGSSSLMLTPAVCIEMSRLRGQAPDGRCKSFSAAADGVGWAEGCGMVVLERLSDARQNHHPVLAVIRGSAVNQDGRSNGLTAPNGPSQEAVIRQALAQAGVRPADVEYVECHGTGTPLGDPIEVQALGAVLGEGREPHRPLVIGSVKTNLGHPRAAAGMAGIIKTVLALEHGRIPKNLHFHTPSPHIAWGELPVKVAAEAVAWPRTDRPRIAGVSAFGISGTNAHFVLEEAAAEDARSPAETPVRSAELVVLSAKSAAALKEAASRLRAHLEGRAEQGLGDVAFSLGTTRTHHEYRLALSVSSREGLAGALGVAGTGELPAGAARGEASASAGKLTWLFTGQGAQALGMGRELHAEWAVFRDALEQAWAALDPHLEERLRDVMWAASGTALAAKLDETAYTQPALFALEVALSALWRSWGIEPDFVAGHSIGELAAAQVAGVLSLADAARLVAARGRLMQALPRGGAMVAIGASERDVAAAVEPHAASVSIAAVNGPESVVISGAEASVLSIGETFASRGARTKRLAVSHAFHSPLMEPMLDAFRSVAESVRYHAPRVPLVSNVTGGVAGGEILRAEYWVRHVREAVRFGDGVRALYQGGAKRFLEVGPRATLLGLVPGCLPSEAQEEVVLWASLRAERAEAQAVLEALGGVYADGGTVDWRGVFPAGGRRVQLPTYPWRRERYWIEGSAARTRGVEATGHALLGVRLSVAAGADALYESVLSRGEQPWLYEHRVGEQAVVPGAAIAELVRAVGEHRFEGDATEVSSLVLLVPLVLPEHGGQRVQVVVTQADDRTEATVYSQPAEAGPEAEWTRHASAQLRAVRDAEAAPARLDLMAVGSRCTEAVDVAQAYEAYASAGLEYGAAFRGMRSLRRGQGEAVAEVVLPEGVRGAHAYGVHPALLDAAFHAVIGLSGIESLWLPFAIDRLRVFQAGATSATAHVRALARPAAGEAFAVDVTLADAQGHVLVEVSGLRARHAEVEAIERSTSGASGGASDALYRVEWPIVSLPSARSPLPLPPGRWRVVADSGNAVAEALTERLRARGAECVLVPGVVGLEDVVPAEHVVCVWGKKPGEEASAAALRNASEGLVVSQLLARQSSALRLRWVTQGAMAVTPAEGAAVELASLWGLGRSVRQEHPELGCRLIDVDAKASVDAAAAALVDELCADDDEPEVAWRDGERHVGRIVRVRSRGAHVPGRGDVVGAEMTGRPDGTVLVTGGLGALGLHVARWLVRRGVKHLVLTGRRGTETPGARQAVAELEGRGAQVTVASVDVADREALRAVLEAIPRELPLRGVVHAAGVLDDGVLLEQTAERLGRVMSPKVEGACHLDALTRGADLDFFVLFSSAAGTLGSAGQAGYTAANACLDALAAQRVAEGLPGQSLAWGLWTDAEGKAAGMASGLDRAQQTRAAQGGIDAVSPAQAMALLEAALTRPEAQLMPVPLDVRRMRKALDGVVPPVWRALVRGSPRTVNKTSKRGAWALEINALPETERMAAVLHVVRMDVARALALGGPEVVAADRPLKDIGLDSLMAVELRNSLGKRAAATLPATLAFDYPTPEAIAKYLLDRELVVVEAKALVAPLPVSRPVDEPIAIVGMGCRYPGGVTDPESLWGLLDAGVDAVTEVPAERWDIGALYDPDPDAAGKMVTRSGGFVRGVDRFDAGFFGISPREAVSLDPQHRLLLETSWEALERAGIAPDSLTGSSTGVFVGLMYQDYVTLAGGLEKLDGYVGTGSAPSIASGRISYVLGLQGPSMTVDTACSSSLVTVHLACQALRSGECSMALAGGASLMMTPSAFVEFSRLRGVAPDGRCKSFSAAADGVGWSEGCGMLVLERLSDARQNGHAVLAVIRGSAVNQDGRSNGLTAPNGLSQEAVIRRALGQAGVQPAEVDYVECHGTGTSLGDPIEVQALSAVLSEGRDRDRPVVIGSVKSNLGHTQAAAGVAGMIKTVLALEHERIPKNLHFNAPSPHIAWDALPVNVAADAVAWPRNDRPRIAGVSSFGVSGTNAHVVLEEAPSVADGAAAPVRSAELVVLSAKSAAALKEAASRLRAHLEGRAEQGLGDVAFSLGTTRTHHEYRLALSVSSREGLAGALGVAGAGELPAGAARGEASASAGKLTWLFTGQGAQALGMGRELHAEWAVFRDALEQAWAALDPHLEERLRDVMWAASGTASAAKLDETAYTQPALFALEVALSALWRSWGIEPDFVAGHSIGELAAAQVAGVLSLADAARLVAARGRLMQALPRGGAMVAIGASERDVAAAVEPHAASVSIAAVNGPESVVISGAEASVLSIAETFASRGARTKRLAVSHAFHSPLMEPMLDAFRSVAESVKYHAPRVPLVSNVTGGVAGGEILRAEYWVRHVREAVRFGDGVRALYQGGAKRFLEVGPRATLLGLVPGCLPPDAQEEVVLWASLRAERAEVQAVLEALGGVYADGGTVDWRGVFPGGGRRVQLPTYPWERQRYWAETKPTRGVGAETEHPLLGVRVSLAGATTVYESVWSLTEQRWLGEHRVGDQVFMPGAGIAEVVRAAGEQCLGEPAEVLSLVLEEPLVLPEHGGQRVQVVVTQEDNRTEATVYSQPAEARPGAEWTRHAGAQLRAVSVTGAAAARLDVMAARRRCTEAVDVAQAYEAFSAAGLEYGAAFRGMRSLHRGQGEALAEVVLPEVVEGVDTYGVHPALLDAAFHAVIGLSRIERGLESLWLPFAIDRLRVFQTGARSATAHVRALASQVAGEAFAADVTLTDDQGQVLVEVSGLRGRQADVGDLAKRASRGDALYRVEWPVVSLPSVRSPLRLPPGRWRVVADSGNAVAEALTERLRARGAECVLVPGVVGLADVVPAEHVVCVWGKKPGEEASDAARRNASEGLVVSQLLARQSSALQLRWVTQGAVAVTPAEGAAVGLASLWGLGRTVRQEHPELGCRLIDVDAKASVDAVVAALVDELCAGDDEPEVAWRDGERHVGRIMRAVARASVSRRGWRPDGTALVTGGLGALGLHVARWLVGRGVKHLVLTGRRGTETPGARQAVAELEGRGAQVTVASVDVADREALRAVLEAIPRELPLRGVVHAAGVLDDGVLLEQTAERLGRVMSPKVEGACHLDALTRGADLDFFVLFSSAAGTLGSAGQAGYTAANACLDALAAQRVAEGLPGKSLAWGLWTDAEGKAAGMASGLDRAQQTRAVQGGIDAVSPAQAMALLEAALTRPESQLMPVPLDVRRMRKAFDGVVPPIWRALVRESPRAARKDGAWAEEIGTLREPERMAAVLHVVRTEVARVLGLGGPETVAPGRPLKELGLDSLMAVQLRNSLGKRAAATLPATLAFDYPTPEAMTNYLVKALHSTLSEGTDRLLQAIEKLDAELVAIGNGEERKRIAERLMEVVARWTSASLGREIATVPQDPKDLTDAELYELVDQQAALADLEMP